jgi:hypothetical protein
MHGCQTIPGKNAPLPWPIIISLSPGLQAPSETAFGNHLKMFFWCQKPAQRVFMGRHAACRRISGVGWSWRWEYELSIEWKHLRENLVVTIKYMKKNIQWHQIGRDQDGWKWNLNPITMQINHLALLNVSQCLLQSVKRNRFFHNSPSLPPNHAVAKGPHKPVEP